MRTLPVLVVLALLPQIAHADPIGATDNLGLLESGARFTFSSAVVVPINSPSVWARSERGGIVCTLTPESGSMSAPRSYGPGVMVLEGAPERTNRTNQREYRDASTTFRLVTPAGNRFALTLQFEGSWTSPSFDLRTLNEVCFDHAITSVDGRLTTLGALRAVPPVGMKSSDADKGRDPRHTTRTRGRGAESPSTDGASAPESTGAGDAR